MGVRGADQLMSVQWNMDEGMMQAAGTGGEVQLWEAGRALRQLGIRTSYLGDVGGGLAHVEHPPGGRAVVAFNLAF